MLQFRLCRQAILWLSLLLWIPTVRGETQTLSPIQDLTRYWNTTDYQSENYVGLDNKLLVISSSTSSFFSNIILQFNMSGFSDQCIGNVSLFLSVSKDNATSFGGSTVKCLKTNDLPPFPVYYLNEDANEGFNLTEILQFQVLPASYSRSFWNASLSRDLVVDASGESDGMLTLEIDWIYLDTTFCFNSKENGNPELNPFLTVKYSTCSDNQQCLDGVCQVPNARLLEILIPLSCFLVLLSLATYVIYVKYHKVKRTSKDLRERLLNTRGFELDHTESHNLYGIVAFGDGEAEPETTLMNTKLEVSLPGFLNMDFNNQLELSEKIGGGGSAGVFKGILKDSNLQMKYGFSEVAIKKVADVPGLTAEENQIRFQQEVAILWSLNSQLNIMKLIGYSNKPRCIITKLYLTDLFQLIHTSSFDLTPKMIFNLTLEIVGGLSAIHDNEIAHRDIKSPNILLESINEQGKTRMTAIIGDFGTARSSESREIPHMVVLNLKGMSPRYAAPEVFSHFKAKSTDKFVQNSSTGSGQGPKSGIIFEPTIDEEQKSDVYSFGVIVWELLTRKRPWDDCQTTEEIEMQVMQGHREEIPPQKDKILQALSASVQSCWVLNPNQRPKAGLVYAQLVELLS